MKLKLSAIVLCLAAWWMPLSAHHAVTAEFDQTKPITFKGKGFEPAEADPIKYHGVTQFDPVTGAFPAGKANARPSYTQIFSDWLCQAAAEDADVSLRLANILEKRLQEISLTDLFAKVEMPLVDVLCELEFNGVTVDAARLANHARSAFLNPRAPMGRPRRPAWAAGSKPTSSRSRRPTSIAPRNCCATRC